MNCATHSSFSLDIFADEKPADDYSSAIMESSFMTMIGLDRIPVIWNSSA